MHLKLWDFSFHWKCHEMSIEMQESQKVKIGILVSAGSKYCPITPISEKLIYWYFESVKSQQFFQSVSTALRTTCRWVKILRYHIEGVTMKRTLVQFLTVTDALNPLLIQRNNIHPRYRWPLIFAVTQVWLSEQQEIYLDYSDLHWQYVQQEEYDRLKES